MRNLFSPVLCCIFFAEIRADVNDTQFQFALISYEIINAYIWSSLSHLPWRVFPYDAKRPLLQDYHLNCLSSDLISFVWTPSWTEFKFCKWTEKQQNDVMSYKLQHPEHIKPLPQGFATLKASLLIRFSCKTCLIFGNARLFICESRNSRILQTEYLKVW